MKAPQLTIPTARHRATLLAATLACASIAAGAEPQLATDPDTPAAPPPAVSQPPAPPAPEHEITPAETEAARALGGPETGTDTPPEAGAAPASRGDAYAEFRRLFDARQYAEAIVPAQQVVVLTEQDAAGNGELEVALMNLAATQSLAADYTAAESSYLRVIELIEAEGTRASPRLARANAGLAVAYNGAGRHELAVARFESALALSRRNEGLFNDAQLPLLDKFTDSLTSMDRVQEAHDAQRYGLRIVERQYGRDSPQIVPRLETIARWYTRVGAYDAARLSLRRAITIVERNLGANSVELIGPLTALAENYRRPLLDPADRTQGYDTDPNPANRFNTIPGTSDGSTWRLPSALAAEGERALERAAAIAESQPQPSPARIADVRTQLGDWYQTRLQHEKALPHYQAAWAAARQVKSGEATLAEALFARPVLLHYIRPTEWDRFERRPAAEVSPHTVEVDVTVTAEGRVRGAEIVTNDGSARMAQAAIEAAETARYRPRLIEGKPSDTTDVRFAQVYFEPIPAAAPEAPAETGRAAGS
jgi:TonB family protein